MYTCRTNIQQKEEKENGERSKRSTNKIDQRPTRFDSPTIPIRTTNARLPNNHHHPPIIRRILRTQHNLSAPKYSREKRVHKKRVEHGKRTTKKSLPTNQRWKKRTELYCRLAKHNMQNHGNRKTDSSRPRNADSPLRISAYTKEGKPVPRYAKVTTPLSQKNYRSSM